MCECVCIYMCVCVYMYVCMCIILILLQLFHSPDSEPAFLFWWWQPENMFHFLWILSKSDLMKKLSNIVAPGKWSKLCVSVFLCKSRGLNLELDRKWEVSYHSVFWEATEDLCCAVCENGYSRICTWWKLTVPCTQFEFSLLAGC